MQQQPGPQQAPAPPRVHPLTTAEIQQVPHPGVLGCLLALCLQQCAPGRA